MRVPVSIIVIAHSNARTLSRCLKSVEDSVSSIDQKILVLNNASFDVRAISQTLSSDWLIIPENDLIGPQHARNIGAKNSKNDYLIFLDDDIEISEAWIKLMLNQFSDPKVGIAQGHIQFETHAGIFWNFLRYKNLGYFKKMRSREVINMCDTAAIMVKKRWFEAVGGFSKDLRIGEDSYFAYKVSINGGVIKFNASVSVKQIYDENETFINHLLRYKDLAINVVPLYLKTRRSSHIYLSQLHLKKIKGCRRPIIYWLINLVLSLYFQSELNSSRNLFKAGTEKFIVRKNKEEF